MIRSLSSRLMKCAAWIGILILSGCATYHPLPLPATPDLSRVPALTVPASEFWLPGLKPHPFPPNGLDETAVITLAVFNDPDLKAARLQAGVANAQMLQAGLLPDPTVSADFTKSVLNYGGDIALSEDIHTLIARGAAKAAARSNQKQVHLNILWQEWQVAEKAKELFIQARTDSRLRKVLTSTRALLAHRYLQDESALKKDNLTLMVTAADLSALNNVDTALRQLQLKANLTLHGLNGLNYLLGLQPGARFRLIGPIESKPLSKNQFQAALASIGHRRADLLALKAGYESQEQNVRQAVLAQFPALTVGVVESRDPVEGVNDFGPTVTLTLPLFNRNRGQIAIQRANRAALRQAYQARLDQAVSNAYQAWEATRIIEGEVHDLDARLPTMRKTALAAQANFRNYNLNTGLYVSMESKFLAAQTQAIRLRASLEIAQSVLTTLLGLPFGTP